MHYADFCQFTCNSFISYQNVFWLMVPDQVLWGQDPLWHHGSSWYGILDFCVKFQLSCMIGSVSRTPLSSKSLLGGCWWFLTMYLEDSVIFDIMDPHDMRFLSLDLCAKFQVSSMIASVSRTPCPWCLYFEDTDGSWPGTFLSFSFFQCARGLLPSPLWSEH